MKRLSPVIKKAWERMDELKDRALELIAKRIWKEVSELVLSEFVFDQVSCVRIGDDAGETEAEQLLIYMLFNRKLEASGQLIDEMYNAQTTNAQAEDKSYQRLRLRFMNIHIYSWSGIQDAV